MAFIVTWILYFEGKVRPNQFFVNSEYYLFIYFIFSIIQQSRLTYINFTIRLAPIAFAAKPIFYHSFYNSIRMHTKHKHFNIITHRFFHYIVSLYRASNNDRCNKFFLASFFNVCASVW